MYANLSIKIYKNFELRLTLLETHKTELHQSGSFCFLSGSFAAQNLNCPLTTVFALREI